MILSAHQFVNLSVWCMFFGAVFVLYVYISNKVGNRKGVRMVMVLVVVEEEEEEN